MEKLPEYEFAYIYGLECPLIEQIRYIGKTVKLKKRLNYHLTDFSQKCRRVNWIKKLLSKNLAPNMIVIDKVPYDEWKKWEMHYIRLFKSFGAKLLNRTDGGDWTPDSRGEKNGNYGKIGALNHRARSVLVFDLKGNFIEEIGSMRLVEKIYKIDFSSIVKCCTGKLYRAKNYTFRYKSDYNEIPSQIEVKKRKYYSGAKHPTSIGVIQYDLEGNLIGKFNTITEANLISGVSIRTIRKHINNQIIKPRKYIWVCQ